MSFLGRTEPALERADPNELPAAYGKDEVELLCRNPRQCFVYWEVTDAGLAEARSHLRLVKDPGTLLLRIFSTAVQSGGRELRDIRDVALAEPFGSRYLDAPRPGSAVRVAVGLLSEDGLFAPIAHSSVLHVPPEQPARETSSEWLNVQPVCGRGYERERIVTRPDPAHHERGVSFGVRNRERLDGPDSDCLWFEGPPQGKGSGGLAGAPAASNAPVAANEKGAASEEAH